MNKSNIWKTWLRNSIPNIARSQVHHSPHVPDTSPSSPVLDDGSRVTITVQPTPGSNNLHLDVQVFPSLACRHSGWRAGGASEVGRLGSICDIMGMVWWSSNLDHIGYYGNHTDGILWKGFIFHGCCGSISKLLPTATPWADFRGPRGELNPWYQQGWLGRINITVLHRVPPRPWQAPWYTSCRPPGWWSTNELSSLKWWWFIDKVNLLWS